jgi:hypothetical protein
MGHIHTYKCNNCGHETGISGPWEFYRDSAGTLKHYGHPVACSEEAEKSGVKGFYKNLYCPNCKLVKRVIEMEFEQAVPRFGVWRYALAFKDEANPVCPDCGSKLSNTLDGVMCQQCKIGKYASSEFLIS